MSILRLVVTFLGSLFKSRRQLVLENLALKQQVAMLRQSVKRPTATAADRMFWIRFSRYVDGWRTTLHALHPDTVVRWHRRGHHSACYRAPATARLLPRVSLALAEPVCRTCYRLHPPGLSGSYDHHQRAASEADSPQLFRLLPLMPDPLVLE
jgi:hypothetical protein